MQSLTFWVAGLLAIAIMMAVLLAGAPTAHL
jgi:hypothetical protein